MGAQHSSVDEDPHIDAEEAAPEDLWLLPMKTLLDFGHLQTFEELQQKGRLVRPSRRKVVLISHEWASPTQPDPKMQQMSVLQHVVRNLCAGRVALGGEAHVEPSQLEMQSCYDWDVWYDYCCLPEARSQRPSASYLQKLYASVDYLVVLAPPTNGPGGAMSLSSHSKSGWCLLDMMAAKLGEKPVLAVTGPRSIFRYSAKAWVREMPHKGQFTKASDQELVKAVAAALLERKRRELYGRNKEAWLFMTALAQRLQRVDCRSLSSFWSRYEMSPKDLAPAKEGFSPLMLAAIEGNCSTLQQLLDGKADPNELRQTVLGEATALCCATMSSLPVIRLLLDAGASPKAGHPMGWAVEYRNLEMMNLLPRSEVHRCAVDGSAVVHLAVLAMDASILDVLLQMGAKATTRSGQFRAHLQDAKRCSVYSTASTTASTSQARKSRWIRLSKSSLSLSEVTARDSERASEEPTVTDTEGPVISVSLDDDEEPGKTQEVLLSTPLEIACYIGHLEMVQLLFHKGADPQERRCKYSALELAEACGHHAIVRFLSIAMQMNSFSV